MRGVVAGLERTLLPASSVTVVDRVPLDAQDFRSVISKMKARNFDVLGVMLISGQISSFYKQMKVQNLMRPTFGPDFLDSTAELNAAGSTVEGAFHPNFDVIDDFRARYVAVYGNDTQIPFAANSYDVANIVAELFGSESRRPKSPEDVVTAIRSVRDYHGANGTMSVTEGEGKDYFFKYPLILKEARAGRSVTMR